MAKIDRLGWVAGLSFSAYGVAVGLRADDADALVALTGSLPPGWQQRRAAKVDRLYSVVAGGARRPGVRRFSILYRDAVRLVRSHQMPEVAEALAADLQLYVAEHARRRVF